MLIVNIQTYLRTIVFFKILNKLLRRAWQLQFLRLTREIHQFFNQLFLCRFLCKFNKYSRCMTIQYRNTDTLRCNNRALCLHNLTILNMSPES